MFSEVFPVSITFQHLKGLNPKGPDWETAVIAKLTLAATNSHFHYQLICRLFSLLFPSIKCPDCRAHGDVLRCLVLPNQQSKTGLAFECASVDWGVSLLKLRNNKVIIPFLSCFQKKVTLYKHQSNDVGLTHTHTPPLVFPLIFSFRWEGLGLSGGIRPKRSEYGINHVLPLYKHLPSSRSALLPFHRSCSPSPLEPQHQ